MSDDERKVSDQMIETLFLKKYGLSIFDYPGKEVDGVFIMRALIRGGEGICASGTA